MGKPKGPSGPGSMSEEDRAAWENTARTLEPLARERRRKRERKQAPPAEPRSERATMPATTRPPVPSSDPVAPSPSRAAPAPFAGIGRRQTRKLSTGQVAIDGRVDLHGMTQAEAHAALRGFLAAARARDSRWVLVITGKGAPRKPSPSEDFAPREPGVLRRNVPLWLGGPDLRGIVVGFRTAAPAHGGDGALYVQLRKRRD